MSDKSLPDRIPRDDWPRGLSLEESADYVGVSQMAERTPHRASRPLTYPATDQEMADHFKVTLRRWRGQRTR